jgi:hypothetical protein
VDTASTELDASSANDANATDAPTGTPTDGRHSDVDRDARGIGDAASEANSCLPAAPICGCDLCGNGRIDGCIAAFDDDTVVLRRHESQGSDWTELLRLDVGGSLGMPPVRLNVGPPTYCHAQMARLGNEVFVAWPKVRQNRAQLTLARVTPY